MPAALETALARHRIVSIAALVALALIAWAWLLSGAGMGMDPLVSLAPAAGGEAHMAGMQMDMPANRSSAYFLLVFSMWWVMMVAMMLPSAAPMILLYARVAASPQARLRPATGSFLAGYLLAWAAFSLGATSLQFALERAGALAPMLMASQSRWLSGAILVLAGLYQLSPLKDACLSRCRNPAGFLSRYHRPGALGALRMGLLHGSFCVGCCWPLMALLFVGGVMNLAWIALPMLMVVAEKLLPHGRAVAIVSGLGFIPWGAALLVR